MFLGVCGGLGKYFNLDPTIVRVFVALTTFFSFGSLLIAYLILAFIVPKEDSINI
jgi:phage shock protein PspC (stress-responsive transcriptional regulator)